MTAKRADRLLVERGLFSTRARAQAEIAAGHVLANNQPIPKPSTKLDEGADLALLPSANKWVSRGALKLLHAVEAFSIDFTDKVVLDIGASTGGFTEVALVKGARHVHAIDVGTDQMDTTLRVDDRVTCQEGLNAKDLTPAIIGEPVDLILCDVSFISLRHILQPALTCAKPTAGLLALIKPQFEAGKAHLNKKGVVADDAVRTTVVDEITRFAVDDLGLKLTGVSECPVHGPAGNIETWLFASQRAAS